MLIVLRPFLDIVANTYLLRLALYLCDRRRPDISYPPILADRGHLNTATFTFP